MYRGCNDSLPLLRNRRTDFLFFFFFSTLPTYNVPALPLPRQVDNSATLAFERVTIEKLSGTAVGIKEKEGNLNFTMIDRNFRS